MNLNNPSLHLEAEFAPAKQPCPNFWKYLKGGDCPKSYTAKQDAKLCEQRSESGCSLISTRPQLQIALDGPARSESGDLSQRSLDQDMLIMEEAWERVLLPQNKTAKKRIRVPVDEVKRRWRDSQVAKQKQLLDIQSNDQESWGSWLLQGSRKCVSRLKSWL